MTDTVHTKQAQTSLLDAALAYAAKGWYVFPCHTPTTTGCSCLKRDACTDIGKHPRTRHGLTDATSAEVTIRRWWKQWPLANIGIRTGALSGLIVLDEDPHKGGTDSREELEHTYHPLPETVQQLTGGGGFHYLFAPPGGTVKNSVDMLGPGLDIRGDGGYIIAPPSLHKSGTRYAWELSHLPEETDLAPMPAWLLALCQDPTRRRATPAPGAADGPIKEGRRNVTLFRMGCALRRHGADEALIHAALKTMNAQRCQPPLPDAVMVKISASAMRYEPSNPVPDDEYGPLPDDLPPLPDEEDMADLLARIQAESQQRRNGQEPGQHKPGPEPADPYACPELPASAATNEEMAAGASLFLDDYVPISKKWAPRAYEGFHEAVALFLLSTIAARRVKIEFGPRGGYTSLYIALAARTTVYTKSTTADIGLALLDFARLSWLLADDDSTPQAFLRSLSRSIPSNYEELEPEEQERVRHQLAFTAQRGWFYEEWGQHLEAMMQKNGYMAGFRSILRRMDDHKDRYTSNTISRGREILHKPYISLLANVTPSDMQPFVKAHSPLWRDGYIARFAFVTPDQSQGSDAEFPEGSLSFPSSMAETLKNWHQRLGVPTCILTPRTDKKGQPLGTYSIDVDPLPEKVYTLSSAVRTAYYAYDRALLGLTRSRQDEDLDGSYGRFPMKALRIAGLLASLHDDSGKYTIWPAQWYRGQQIAERWRRDLHRLMRQVHTSEAPTSPRRQLEDKLMRQVDKSGPQSLRAFAIFQKTHSRDEIEACLATLVSSGELTVQQTTQTTKYGRSTEKGKKV